MEKSWSITFTDLRDAWARQSGHLFKMCLERTWVESVFWAWVTSGPRQVDRRLWFHVGWTWSVFGVGQSSRQKASEGSQFLCVVGNWFSSLDFWQIGLNWLCEVHLCFFLLRSLVLPPSPMISLTLAQAKTSEVQSCVVDGFEREV